MTMEFKELIKRTEFRIFSAFFSSIIFGIVTPFVYKAYVEINSIPPKSYFLYRKKVLESNNNDLEDPLNPKECLEERKSSKIGLIFSQSLVDVKKMIPPFLIGSACGFSLYKFYFLRRIKSSAPGKVMVIFRKFHGNKSGDNDIIRTLYTIPDNLPFPVGKFIYPWQSVGYITEENIPLKKEFKIYSKDGTELTIELDLIIGISEKDVTLSLYRASSQILDLNVEEIKERAIESLNIGLESNIKDFTYNEIEMHLVDFNYYVTQVITWYLKYLGLVVRKAPLVRISSKDGRIDIPLRDLK
ncbi:hypothetical protein ABK040_010576 [Willaertia magna]